MMSEDYSQDDADFWNDNIKTKRCDDTEVEDDRRENRFD